MILHIIYLPSTLRKVLRDEETGGPILIGQSRVRPILTSFLPRLVSPEDIETILDYVHRQMGITSQPVNLHGCVGSVCRGGKATK